MTTLAPDHGAPAGPPPAGAGSPRVLVVGAGPAGLTAAYMLGKSDITCTVVEADDVVGGISRTVERDGWRFDIGGHRFFTKVPEVSALWEEILPGEDFLLRPRLSRIYYRGRYFDYPLHAINALRGLGLVESLACGFSYAWARVRPPADPASFEGFVAQRFGWRLYRTFFKTYTEKVWGVPASEIKADWAAQRIRNLSLGRALVGSVWRGGGRGVTSLIEEFRYPALGPGMMWERASDLVAAQGSEVRMRTKVERIHRRPGSVEAVTLESEGRFVRTDVDQVISSMPLGDLVLALDPPAPPAVRAAAEGLRHRDFLTIALVVPASRGFPDNWIYVHEPGVRLGRVQNFGSWSPHLVKDGRTCLGLEYFVFQGDDLWASSDEDLVALGTRELAAIGLADPEDVEAGYVVRMPRAYPVYDEGYAERVGVIREFLQAEVPNVQAVGRNGMHRYNNQDHSMLTAMLAVENLLGASHDLWSVNVEAEYHEEAVRAGRRARRTGRNAAGPPADTDAGSGRSAPVLPAPV